MWEIFVGLQENTGNSGGGGGGSLTCLSHSLWRTPSDDFVCLASKILKNNLKKKSQLRTKSLRKKAQKNNV